MRLVPLYRIRFTYPESWGVGLDGGWQQLFFLAEGRCESTTTLWTLPLVVIGGTMLTDAV